MAIFCQMSHEIRTYMNAIIGFTNVLFLLKTELDESPNRYISAIKVWGMHWSF
jgi:signal transduction histidine kinase